MKKGSLYIFTLLYVLIGAAIFLSPSSIIFAQDDSVEEIFWGDEDSGDLDEEFEFSEDDEFSDEEKILLNKCLSKCRLAVRYLIKDAHECCHRIFSTNL